MNLFTRRRLLFASGVGGLALGLPAFAQQAKPLRRIAYLSSSNAQTNASWLDAFRKGMAALRWVEGRNFVLDARFADSALQSTEEIGRTLVATRPDLLLTPGDRVALELVRQTKTIPVVFVISQDPVGSGLVESLQRPNRNATGLTAMARELSAKRLQLLKEAFPNLQHVAPLLVPSDPSSVAQAREVVDAGARLGVRITPIEVARIEDIDRGLRKGSSMGVQAYVITASALFLYKGGLPIVESINRLKVPGIFPIMDSVRLGGVLAYGPSLEDSFRRAAAYVDRIFNGAKPGDLPVEQPTEFDFGVNLKTARALGIALPDSVRLRATQVVE